MARASSYTSRAIDNALTVERTLSGIDVVYRRGEVSQALVVVPGETAADLVDDDGTVSVAYDQADFLFAAADIASEFGKPAAGDRIEIPDADGEAAAEVYELVPMDDHADFTYRDPARLWVRVRSVLLAEN